MTYSIELPTTGGDLNTWGPKLNAALTVLKDGLNTTEGIATDAASAAATAQSTADSAALTATSASNTASTAQSAAESATTTADGAATAAANAQSTADSATTAASTAQTAANNAQTTANAARPKTYPVVFPVQHNGTAWEYASLAEAQAAGLQPGDNLLFLGTPDPPAWASEHGRVAAWTQGV